MLVCPNCRNDNPEEAQVCRVCGRSLEPVGMALRRPEGAERAEDLDVAPPKPPGAWPGILLLVALVVGIVAAGVWYGVRPEPCQGKFVSSLYGYCMEIPEGWTGGSVRTPIGATDRFRTRDEGAVVHVRSGEVAPGVNTAQYAQGFRSTEEAAGLSVGPTQSVAVGEESTGLAWEASGEVPELGLVRQREVVVVRGTEGWRITLFGTLESFDEARLALNVMLNTWSWQEAS